MLILYCGLSEYPNNKSASINRYTSIAKAMKSNNEIIFINRIANKDISIHSPSHEFEFIDACRINQSATNFFKRNFTAIIIFVMHYIYTIMPIIFWVLCD